MNRRSPFDRIPERDWNDWQWQQAHRIRDLAELSLSVELTDEEVEALDTSADVFAFATTPYYTSLIDPEDPNCPVRRQAIPSLAELNVLDSELEDPLAEDTHMPVPNLTHRYPDRALLYASHNCPVYCRHCNRKRKVADPKSAPSRGELDEAIAYVQATPSIRDVLVSGGDPLSLSDSRLDDVLTRLRAIPHLEIIRLATRTPVTLPQRITEALAERLADAGCVLSNQMVLLKGINDRADVVRELNHWLLRHRCRPYYIFQADAVQGTSHFRTPVETGVQIVESLRGWTSGLAVPHYVVDLPHGGGKVSLQADFLQGRDGRMLDFRNYRGERFDYEEGF